MEKLSKEAVLARIAMEDETLLVGMAAVKRLDDQSLLGEVSLNALYEDVRKATLARVTDNSVLAAIGAKDDSPALRRTARIARKNVPLLYFDGKKSYVEAKEPVHVGKDNFTCEIWFKSFYASPATSRGRRGPLRGGSDAHRQLSVDIGAISA